VHRLRADAERDRAVGGAREFERPPVDLDATPGRPALEDVVLADELRDEPGGGLPVDLLWRPDLLDAAVVHDGDAVRHRERLRLVVGDVDRRHAGLALDGADLAAETLAQAGVERRQRLVQQEDVRLRSERAGERDPLLLPAGERLRVPVAHPREADEVEQSSDATARVCHVGEVEPVGDVLADAHVREQRVLLEHDADVARLGRDARDVRPAEPHGARGRLLEAGDEPEGGRLPAARRADEREELPVRDVEVDAGECGRRAVLLADARE